MKKWIGYILKTIAGILVLIVVVILFFSVQSNLRESKTRQEAAPSTGRFVQAGDVELFIQEMKPQTMRGTIIFIHGTATWSGLWRETMSRFAEAGYYCIAIDIPPFGFSERPATPSYDNASQAKRIVAMMDTLGLKHAILFGHSFGGGTTLEAALMIPDRVDMLILEDVGGLNLNLQPAPESGSSAFELFLGTPVIRSPILATTATNPLFTKTLISSMVLDRADVTQEKIKILQQPLVLDGATNTLGDWLESVFGPQKVSLTSDPKNYQTLTMPTLILWGDSDTVIPLKEGQYLQSIMPNSELVLMKGVNHIPHLEDLDTVIKLALEFLTRI